MTVVTFKVLEHFLDELKCGKSRIADKIVRYDSVRVSQNEDQTAYNCEVALTALSKGGDEDYLYECLLLAGEDISNDSEEGSKAARAILEKLADTCEACGLEPRPGKIEVF